jgi:hypothetical protein
MHLYTTKVGFGKGMQQNVFYENITKNVANTFVGRKIEMCVLYQ